jgi:hypothetical protein
VTPWEALDWDIRRRVPTFLRAAGLDHHAFELESLSEIHNVGTLAACREACADAAKAAYAAWLVKKPPLASVACDAARRAALMASKETLLSSAEAALPVAKELAQLTDAFLQRICQVAAGDAEGAADHAAAVIACGDFECDDGEKYVRAKARLAGVVKEIKESWR